MSRSFLSSEETAEFINRFAKPSPDSILNEELILASARVNSDWLESLLIQKLGSLGPWLDLHPILLGSWARNELCPCSDLDIIFLGEEEKVFDYINKVQEKGLKLRYRVPKNLA